MFEGRNASTRHLSAAIRSITDGATWWRDELDPRRAGDALGIGGGHFREIFEKAAVGMVVKDAERRPVESNPALRRMLGYDEEELRGITSSDFTHPEDEAEDARLYEELFRGECEGFRVEKRYVRKDGSVMWGRLSTSVMTDADGKPALAIGVVEDIDERKRAELELEESEERYRAVVEQFAEGIFLTDVATGRVLEANPALRALLGYAAGEIEGTEIYDLVAHPREEIDRELRLLLEERRRFAGEWKLRRRDGSLLDAEVGVSVVSYGGHEALCTVVHEVTERGRDAEGLREVEESFRVAFQEAPIGVALTDLDGRYLRVNPAFCALLGRAEEELVGHTSAEFTHPDDLEISRDYMRRVREGYSRTYELEKRYLRAGGRPVWVSLNVSLVRDPDGEPGHYICHHQDVTERKKAEEALQASERRMGAVIEQSPLSIHIFSSDGRSLVSNASWNQLWNLREGELPEGTNIFEDEQLVESGLLEYVRESLEGARVVTPPLLHDPAKTGREGPPRWLEAYVYPVRDEAGRVREMVLIIEDVTEREEAREGLEKSEERFRSLVWNSSDVVMILEESGAIRYENPTVERMLGYQIGERVGAKNLDYAHPEDAEQAWNTFAEARETPGVQPPTQFRLRHKDGSWRHVEVVRNNLLDDPNVRGIVANLRDVTERVRAEEDLRLKNRAVDASSNGILICDMTREDYPIVYSNLAMSRVTGYTPEEILGRNPRFLQGADRDQIEARRLSTAIREGREWFGIIRNYKKDGALFYNEMYVAPVRDEGGSVTHYVGVQNDVTERWAMEDQLAYQAFHDSLTALPNRALFKDRLEQALSRADRHGNAVAVLFMDLDNFKYVNDSLGRETGDELLIGVAERLRWGGRPGDTAARLGGDEFAVLLEEVGGPEDAARVAERVAEELREPLTIRGQEMFASASIGVAASARGGGRAGDLLRDADAAMYEAKREGKNRHKVFESGMGSRASERLDLENDLRRAMRRGEFRLHYQPEVLLRGGRTVGIEALLRWERPGRGLVSPAEFIPVAEETGLIVPLGHWVLREACRQAKEWRGRYANGEASTVWVNLSACQLHQTDLAGEISNVLDEVGLPPENLGLEITESVLVEYGGTAISTLAELKVLGVKVAIDDFGTGYSSLSYLKRLPVDLLKIDRSFVAGIQHSAEDEVLVSAVINLAQALDLKVVAEGVETEDQLRKLHSLGCDLAQGYLFSHPLPAETAPRFLFEEW